MSSTSTHGTSLDPPSRSAPTLHHFTTTISLKLSDDNFLLWEQQVLATTDGLLLTAYLDGSAQPSRPLAAADGSSPSSNSAYSFYKQQDSLIIAWLLASMTVPFLTKMVGLELSSQIWSTLNTYFASNTRAQIKNYKLRLKTSKNDRTVSAYLLEIKKTIDSLAAIGAPVTVEDHVEAILDGLSEDYDPFVASIMSRSEPYTTNEIEALLLAQEERLDKHRLHDPLTSPVTAAFASWNPVNSRTAKSKTKFSNYRGQRGFSRSSSSYGPRPFSSRPPPPDSW